VNGQRKAVLYRIPHGRVAARVAVVHQDFGLKVNVDTRPTVLDRIGHLYTRKFHDRAKPRILVRLVRLVPRRCDAELWRGLAITHQHLDQGIRVGPKRVQAGHVACTAALLEDGPIDNHATPAAPFRLPRPIPLRVLEGCGRGLEVLGRHQEQHGQTHLRSRSSGRAESRWWLQRIKAPNQHESKIARSPTYKPVYNWWKQQCAVQISLWNATAEM
jgi:hypothetical protein